MKKYVVRCKFEQCNWTSPAIFANNRTEAIEIATHIHNTNLGHEFISTTGLKKYFVKCEICKSVILVKLKNGNTEEITRIAALTHDDYNDHEFILEDITLFN